ncbi:unnamed protein product [Camellia sinensis]
MDRLVCFSSYSENIKYCLVRGDFSALKLKTLAQSSHLLIMSTSQVKSDQIRPSPVLRPPLEVSVICCIKKSCVCNWGLCFEVQQYMYHTVQLP